MNFRRVRCAHDGLRWRESRDSFGRRTRCRWGHNESQPFEVIFESQPLCKAHYTGTPLYLHLCAPLREEEHEETESKGLQTSHGEGEGVNFRTESFVSLKYFLALPVQSIHLFSHRKRSVQAATPVVVFGFTSFVCHKRH